MSFNRKSWVYKIINPENNEILYIGRTHDVKSRFETHMCLARNIKDNSKPLYKQMNILISNGIIPIIQDVCETRSCSITERFFIYYFSRKYKLYNEIYEKHNNYSMHQVEEFGRFCFKNALSGKYISFDDFITNSETPQI